MKTKDKINYIIKVVQSCQTNEQIKTARRWAYKLIDLMPISSFDKCDFKHQVTISKYYDYKDY